MPMMHKMVERLNAQMGHVCEQLTHELGTSYPKPSLVLDAIHDEVILKTWKQTPLRADTLLAHAGIDTSLYHITEKKPHLGKVLRDPATDKTQVLAITAKPDGPTIGAFLSDLHDGLKAYHATLPPSPRHTYLARFAEAKKPRGEDPASKGR